MTRILPLVPLFICLSGEQALVVVAPLPLVLAAMVALGAWRRGDAMGTLAPA